MSEPKQIVQVVLAANVNGLRLPAGPLDGVWHSKLLGKVKFTLSTDETPDITVVLDFPMVRGEKEEVIAAAANLGEEIIVRLAYETDIAVGTLMLIEDNLDSIALKKPPETVQAIVREADRITVSISESVRVAVRGLVRGKYQRVLIVGADGQSGLASRLQESQDVSQYHSMYRSIMQSTDSVAQFLLLFALLEMICVPDLQETSPQAKIDAWIREKEPKVENRIAVVRGKERTETIYAWLRNALVHQSGRMQGDFGNVRQSVFRNLDGLKKLIKLAIDQAI